MDSCNSSGIDMCYSMQPNKDGYIGNCIIIVPQRFGNEVRHGAKKDIESLQKLSRMLSLQPRVFSDLKASDIHSMMGIITKPPDKRPPCLSEDIWKSRIMPDHKVILVVIVSHGKTDSFLTADLKLFPVRKLYSFLNEDNCSLMRGKPKIIFFGKCGTKGGDVYETPLLDSDVMNGVENIFNSSSTFSNFLHIYSCSMGTLSLSGTDTESFIISALTKEYEKYGEGKEFRKFIQIFRSQMIEEVNIKVQDSFRYANTTHCITTERDSLLGDIYFPQTGLMAGSSDCESLEEMEVETTFISTHTQNTCDDKMEMQLRCEERLPKSKHLMQRIAMRIKMYKKAHHTYRPGGHKYRIKRNFSLN